MTMRTREQFIARLRQAFAPLIEALQPELVVLFGSFAYGQPHPHSDVDLLIVLPQAPQPDGFSARLDWIERHWQPVDDFPPLKWHIMTLAEWRRELLKRNLFLADITLQQAVEKALKAFSLSRVGFGAPPQLSALVATINSAPDLKRVGREVSSGAGFVMPNFATNAPSGKLRRIGHPLQPAKERCRKLSAAGKVWQKGVVGDEVGIHDFSVSEVVAGRNHSQCCLVGLSRRGVAWASG